MKKIQFLYRQSEGEFSEANEANIIKKVDLGFEQGINNLNIDRVAKEEEINHTRLAVAKGDTSKINILILQLHELADMNETLALTKAERDAMMADAE